MLLHSFVVLATLALSPLSPPPSLLDFPLSLYLHLSFSLAASPAISLYIAFSFSLFSEAFPALAFSLFLFSPSETISTCLYVFSLDDCLCFSRWFCLAFPVNLSSVFFSLLFLLRFLNLVFILSLSLALSLSQSLCLSLSLSLALSRAFSLAICSSSFCQVFVIFSSLNLSVLCSFPSD